MRGGAALAFALALTLLCTILAGGVRAGEPRSREFSKEEIQKMAETRAIIETTLGEMEIKFFPEKAPNHVNNFISLAKTGFYNGTTFHRVIPGFMIQGGDPKSKDAANRAAHGTGGPGYTLKAEFNDISHKRGIVSMARSQDPDSAGSQFFICVADAPWLDGMYTVFGELVSGMDVADRIVSQPRDTRDNPIERVEINVRIVEPAEEPPAGAKERP
jgi:peptidyl-prolyl cis-trans isomerase B (cyclophilin B)